MAAAQLHFCSELPHLLQSLGRVGCQAGSAGLGGMQWEGGQLKAWQWIRISEVDSLQRRAQTAAALRAGGGDLAGRHSDPY